MSITREEVIAAVESSINVEGMELKELYSRKEEILNLFKSEGLTYEDKKGYERPSNIWFETKNMWNFTLIKRVEDKYNSIPVKVVEYLKNKYSANYIPYTDKLIKRAEEQGRKRTAKLGRLAQKMIADQNEKLMLKYFKDLLELKCEYDALNIETIKRHKMFKDSEENIDDIDENEELNLINDNVDEEHVEDIDVNNLNVDIDFD